jgi:hypothetical protein
MQQMAANRVYLKLRRLRVGARVCRGIRPGATVTASKESGGEQEATKSVHKLHEDRVVKSRAGFNGGLSQVVWPGYRAANESFCHESFCLGRSNAPSDRRML